MNLQGYQINPNGHRARMIAARLNYIKRHGARFLFNNEPPPAPGWPRGYRAPEEPSK